MNIKQLKSQSLLQEALQEALCELGDTRLRNLTITKVELSAGKESAKVFLDENSLEGAESARILSALKKASGIIRANISAQLSWYKVPNLRFEVDKDLAQMNRLDEIFKKINNKGSAESSADSAESQNLVKNQSHTSKNFESHLDSATSSPLSLDSFSQKGCTSLPAPSTRQKLRFSLLEGEPRLSASSKKSAGGTTAPFDSDFLHHEAGEFSGASHGFDLDSANFPNSQNLVKNNRARSAHLLKASSGEGVVREGEGSDFAIQAPAPSLKKNARGEKGKLNADLSAQGRKENRDSSPLAQNDKFRVRVAESSLDSADSATLSKNAESNSHSNTKKIK